MRFLHAGSLVLFVPLRGSDFFFFFNDTATTEIYTLSLHDALPISHEFVDEPAGILNGLCHAAQKLVEQEHHVIGQFARSEEHTSDLQSLTNLVCRLLLEKKKTRQQTTRREEESFSHYQSPVHDTHTIAPTRHSL